MTKRYGYKRHIVSTRLSEEEWNAFDRVRIKYNISVQELLRGIIVDAIVDEGYDGLRRRKPERREDPGEASQVGGITTP